ncbi:DUF418 domain-containing protein [Sphingomonas hylomeconis]|uniref:DUF418 domain-containing protein n=1 Tax=Sphingomonas hylomeconis TaxID=1395958 RepID=A0ABV7SUE4_9SPHN|nr:DUF418 domain-containing protein [Sphingomonas hylomeconis]
MTAITMTTPAEPDGAPRIAVLDILRGIAILGILFMNINDMGGSLWASTGDIRHFGWTTADQIAWWLREVFANGTARCLLEMLFGVGMVILTERAAAALGDHAVWRGYYRRNIVLFLFGLAHLFILLWPGDILHTYGLAAMVAFLFRRLPPPALLGIGLLMALSQLAGFGVALHGAQQARIDVPRLEARRAAGATLTASETGTITRYNKAIADQAKAKAEQARRIAREDRDRAAATGTFASWAGNAWRNIAFIWGLSDGIGTGEFLEPLFVWEAAATMLIGAALFKWRVIPGGRSRRFYLGMTITAYAVGLPARTIAAYCTTRFDSYPYLIYATSEVTRLATTLGHIGLINLAVTGVGGAALLRPFVAAGRTALTLYVLQTIIGLWMLYPPFALGLYGKSGWAGLMLSALAINLALLWLANAWMGRFAIAPVEWAWRSIVERRRLPWRKTRDSGRAAGIAAV